MKVAVSVAGAFHALDLAAQLHRHGMLARLVTTWPAARVVDRVGGLLPRARVTSTGLHLPLAALNRLGLGGPRVDGAVRLAHDLLAARTVSRDLDLWAGWSGASLRGLRRARALGVTAVVVRGSSHIAWQNRILSEEYERHGLHYVIDHAVTAQEREEYATADYVQTNSRFAASTLISEGVEAERVLCTPTGVALDLFRPYPKEDDVFRVVFAGQLGVRKGARYLLEAFCALDRPNIELWHLGTVEDAVRPLLKRFDHPGIRLLGHKPMAELPRYYSQCSVFVHPSLEEGLSVVQAQAMACGLPLVCTPNTGGEDLLGAPGVEGFVVPIRDVEALTSRLAWLHDHPEARAEMGRAARARVSAGFTWDDYGDRITHLYRNLPRPSAGEARSQAHAGAAR
jgi:glycosyltransferase involved in cell wall biosynthesis